MNTNSVICNFIKNNPDDWEERLKEKGIIVKEECGYHIFNYDIFCDFYDEVVQESRGIIIDVDALEVVCWPFRKFGNSHEGYADNIDWNTAKVQEKIDGSILKYWFDKKIDSWRFSTNSKIEPSGIFKAIINKALANTKIENDILDKDCTYIFELVSPSNMIVINYNISKLVHIGVRNNLTGKESQAGNIGIEKPKEYELKENTLDACIALAKQVNSGSAKVEHEGFVVVDADFHRIKVKTPEYLLWHKKVSSHRFNCDDCLELIFSGTDKTEEFISQFPDLENVVRYYQYQLAEFCKTGDALCLYADNVFAENNNEKRALALEIKGLKNEYKSIIFEHIKENETTLQILKKRNLNSVAKLFKTYEEPDIMALLYGK